MKNEETREYTISGTILPDEWDEDLKITSIGIETMDEEDYIIYLNKMGKELLSFIDHKVEVTGTVKKMYGDYIFTVKRYNLLKNDENPITYKSLAQNS